MRPMTSLFAKVGVAFAVLLVTAVAPVSAQLGPGELSPEWGQASWSNPAIFHPSGGQIQLGGLAGLNVATTHSGPALLDFSTLGGALNPELLLAGLDPTESIDARAEVPLIGMAFRDEKRFELRLRSRFVADQQFTYDRDLIELGWRGNGHPDVIGRPMSLSGMGMHVQGYFDHGLSVGAMAKEEKLWLGWGIHILNGVGAFHTESFNATWTTDSVDYSWTLEGEADLLAAGLDLDSALSGEAVSAPGGGALPPTIGAGVAFDFGLVWKPSAQFEVEAAMEGRGSIRWLKSVSRAKVDPDVFVLQGLDVVNVLAQGDSLSSLDSLDAVLSSWGEEMVDSLAGTFEVQTGPEVVEAFNTPIQETWRLGFRYRPRPSLEFHAMAYRQFRFDRSTDGVVIGVVHRLRGNVATQVQAQLVHGRWSWGAGLSLRGGPLRMAFSAQNVPGLLLPLESGHWQGRFGIGFELGYRQDKKKSKRKNPLGTGKGMWH